MMSPFGGLLNSRPAVAPASGDAAAGASADAAAGGPGAEMLPAIVPVVLGQGAEPVGILAAADTDEEEEEGTKVPKKPLPPTRMPRRLRGCTATTGIDTASEECASIISGGSCSSVWSRSPQGTPVSPMIFAPDPWCALLDPATQHLVVPATPPPAGRLVSAGGLTPQPTKQDDTNGPRTHVAMAAMTAAAAERHKAKKARDSFDYGDYCCFRGSRERRSAHDEARYRRRAACEAIREDGPMEFDRDVAVLELRSLLWNHGLEPSEGLMGAILRWQARWSHGLGRPAAAAGEEAT